MDGKSSGESTPSDGSPKNVIKQDSMPSADSSPLLNKVTKQETSSSEGSPLVNKVTTQEVTSSDDTPPVTSEKDGENKETLSISDLVTKQKVSPKSSSNGPVISVSRSFVDEILQQYDTKATTSDYYSSNDLRNSEDAGLVPTVPPATASGEDTTDATASVVAMMKSRGHARTHSAPLILDEETKATDTVGATTSVTTSSSDVNKENNKERKEAPPIMVHYLGPLVLRKEVESLLIREGMSYLGHKEFPVLSPTVFWNLVSVPSLLSSSVVMFVDRFGTSLGLACHLTYLDKPLCHSLTSLTTRYLITPVIM